MDTGSVTGNRKGRPNYSIEFKRQLALAASEPGVSVSKLALAHELNTNMVFKWRRELRAGLLDMVGADATALLPVEVVAHQEEKPATSPNRSKVPPATPRRIEISVADAVIRIDGVLDIALLQAIFQSLRS